MALFGEGAELIEHTCTFQREDDGGNRNVDSNSCTDLRSLNSSSVTLISKCGVTLEEHSLFFPGVSGSSS